MLLQVYYFTIITVVKCFCPERAVFSFDDCGPFIQNGLLKDAIFILNILNVLEYVEWRCFFDL